MRKGKVMSKVFGIVLVCSMIGIVFGGAASAVSSLAVKKWGVVFEEAEMKGTRNQDTEG